MTVPTISPISLGQHDFGPLQLEARGEGIGFVDRLVEEWESGDNRFDGDGEKFLGVLIHDGIAAFGGFNINPYSSDRIGRLRHLYVRAVHRRKGIGQMLVSRVLKDAGMHFPRVRLRTTTKQAAAFYESLGFMIVVEKDATHSIDTGVRVSELNNGPI